MRLSSSYRKDHSRPTAGSAFPSYKSSGWHVAGERLNVLILECSGLFLDPPPPPPTPGPPTQALGGNGQAGGLRTQPEVRDRLERVGVRGGGGEGMNDTLASPQLGLLPPAGGEGQGKRRGRGRAADWGKPGD